jgi:hypothetical protein
VRADLGIEDMRFSEVGPQVGSELPAGHAMALPGPGGQSHQPMFSQVAPSGARSASQNIAWMIPTVRARCGSERSARYATASSTRAAAPVSGR